MLYDDPGISVFTTLDNQTEEDVFVEVGPVSLSLFGD